MPGPLKHSISALESTLGDPRLGLPEDLFLFVSRIVPLISVDLLIQDDRGSTLLTWREDEFFGTGWHVPGGVIRYKETAADRVRACACEELGAKVSFEAVPLLVSETVRPHENRGHCISLLFRCQLVTPPMEARRAGSNSPSSGEWRWHHGCPPDLLEAQRQYVRFL